MYNDFVITSLDLGTGQIQEIEVKLGESFGVTEYELRSKRHLTPEKVTKWRKSLHESKSKKTK